MYPSASRSRSTSGRIGNRCRNFTDQRSGAIVEVDDGVGESAVIREVPAELRDGRREGPLGDAELPDHPSAGSGKLLDAVQGRRQLHLERPPEVRFWIVARPPKTFSVCVAPSTPVLSKFSELVPTNGSIATMPPALAAMGAIRGKDIAISKSQRCNFDMLILAFQDLVIRGRPRAGRTVRVRPGGAANSTAASFGSRGGPRIALGRATDFP